MEYRTFHKDGGKLKEGGMDEWLKKVQESIGVSQKEQMKKKCEIGEGEQDKFVK